MIISSADLIGFLQCSSRNEDITSLVNIALLIRELDVNCGSGETNPVYKSLNTNATGGYSAYHTANTIKRQMNPYAITLPSVRSFCQAASQVIEVHPWNDDIKECTLDRPNTFCDSGVKLGLYAVLSKSEHVAIH